MRFNPKEGQIIITASVLSVLTILTVLTGQPVAPGLTLDQGGIVRGPVDKKQIALVFTADSYGEGLDYVLDELDRKGARASFFLTGNFLRNQEFRPLVEKIVRGGHYVGPHSDRHLLYCDWQDRQKTLITEEEFLADLEANYTELEKAGVMRSRARYFLPPYEWYNRQIVDWAGQAGSILVNFTPGLTTNADYTSPDMAGYRTSEEIEERLLEYESAADHGLNGFIILIHPGVAPERTDLFYFRLGRLIAELGDRGYSFVRVDELLSGEDDKEENDAINMLSSGVSDSLTLKEREKNSGKRQELPEGETAARTGAGRSQAELSARRKSAGTSTSQGELSSPTADSPAFSLSRAWVSWKRGRLSGLARSGDRVLTACLSSDGPDGLNCFLDSLESGRKLQFISLPRTENFSLTAGPDGFCLILENRVVFVETGTLETRELLVKRPEAPTSVALAGGKRLILLFAGKLEACDLKTGELLWEHTFQDESSGRLAAASSEVMVILASSRIIRLNGSTGKVIARHDFQEEITGVEVEGDDRIYLTTASGNLTCFDLRKSKVRWRLNLGSQQLEHLLAYGRHLYALTSGGILYKLKKSGGDILWWQTVPGRTAFKPAILEDEIIVPAGQVLYGFDLKTGRKSSETSLSFEVKTDLVASDNRLLVGTYDYRQDLSLIYALKKEPRIIIRPSRESPQAAGRRLVFTVLAYGFENPGYEFFLSRGSGPERRVRKASRENVWSWLPAEPGEYTIAVRVFDRKLSKKSEMRYNITSFSGN